MADDFQDKTETASQKKLDDSRKKGQVAKSQDLTASLMLLSGMAILFFISRDLFYSLTTFVSTIYRNLNANFGDYNAIVAWFREGLSGLISLVAPVLGGLFIVALIVNIFQVKLVLSLQSLVPKWENLNIFNPKSYKKFFSLSSVMKLVFGMSKLTVVGVVIYNVIISDLAEMTRLMEAEVGEILLFIIFKAALIGVLIALVLIVLGIADYTYQKWKFANDMKMTKQEVKEEYKQMEGDTHVKSKMKQMMQSFSRNRMKDNVPEADVIIANPVHYAIAVKYDPEGMAAPVCLAKGARKMALSIKEIAKENKIPIVENPLLARMLYKAVEVGELVPPQFYHAVAEVLAYVYRLNEKVDEKSQAAS